MSREIMTTLLLTGRKKYVHLYLKLFIYEKQDINSLIHVLALSCEEIRYESLRVVRDVKNVLLTQIA
jgi:hypothetical protein